MNSIISTPSSITSAGGGIGGAIASQAAGLPDFAALLGLTLALGELENGMGADANSSALAWADPALQACLVPASSAQPASADGENTTPISEDDEDAAEESDLVTTCLPGIAVIAPLAPSVSSENLQSPAPSQISYFKSQIAGNDSTIHPSPLAPGATPLAWNVRDLNHHIQAAISSQAMANAQQGNAMSTQAQAGGPVINVMPPLAQAGGEKIHIAQNQNPQQTLNQAQAQAGMAIQPAAAAAADQGAAQQFLASPDPRFQAPSNFSAALDQHVQAAAADDFDPSAAPALDSSAQPLLFVAHPVADEAGVTRTPGMSEQVRQVADFLAERTEGVIRLSQDGVEANLRLYPPDLGGVRVQLSMTSDRATQAQFIVERPETAQLLQQNLRAFQQGLESHGLTVDRVQVTVQTARPAASTPDSGWRQQSSPDPRRENSTQNDRNQQNRRNPQNPEFFG